MNFSVFQKLSLKARVTLFILPVFLISIWTVTFIASKMLRQNVQYLVSNQQFSTVSLVADQINQELENRINALESIALSVSPFMNGNTAALQTFLEQSTAIQNLFNAGMFVTGSDGIGIADVPLSTGRIGVNYMDREYMHAALVEGKTTISQPMIGRKKQTSLFAIAAPVRDSQGNVTGALTGAIDLAKPNFLDRIIQNRYGKSGGYILISPQCRLMITGTDKTRIMTPLPAPGINPLLDRYMQGFEGSGIVVDARGMEVLSSAKQIPAAGWFIVARMPTAEAFAPIRSMQQIILLTCIGMSLLLGVMIWWMLGRQFAPMLAAVNILAFQSNTDLPLKPLPITRQDEIGQLISGFNHLLGILEQRDHALHESSKRLSDIIEFLPDATLVVDKERRVIIWNRAIEKMTGISASEIIGRGDYAYAVPFYGEERPILIDYIFMEDADLVSKYPVFSRESDIFTAEVYCNALYNNKGAWVFAKVSLLRDPSGTVAGAIECIRDITDRKTAEEQLLLTNQTLERRVAQEVQKNMEQERMLIHQSRMAAMGEMIGNIAHQWRQPLNALGLLLFNFKDAYQYNELDEAFLEKNIATGSRLIQNMSSTINDFRNFFQPDKEKRAFSALEKVNEAVALVGSSFQHNNIIIHIDALDDLMLSGFPNEYSQVLLNLLSNAKDAILKNCSEHSGRVDIVLARLGGQGCISVTDNGGGIPADIIGRIFDPYFSTKEKGSGIGLFMSKMIIESNMNGSITAKNIGGGAEFTVSVPLAAEDISR